ncbi:MAG TPA: pyridoxamine 5'-phosphate oxidase [Bacteroidota bacterium]|nr:pyridoxamine 5'-phosphate oxidase [Bacteroidota bacterium]
MSKQKISLADLRTEYMFAGLHERDAAKDPIDQFERWFHEAHNADLPEVNAMTLATASKDGIPNARIVLLKGVDTDGGFLFFTNYDSTKGRELVENPNAALVFFWPQFERQVRIAGAVQKVTRRDSEEYFHTRPVSSQVGAWASQQSRVVSDREMIENEYRRLAHDFKGQLVPLPPYWGGFRLMPKTIEFWQGRPKRLHDRLRYVRLPNNAWRIERLAP